MSDYSQQLAYKGDNIELYGCVSNVDIEDGFATILTYTVTTGKTFYITDTKVNASSNGIFRMKYDGSVCCSQGYRARDCVDFSRNMPIKALSAKVIIIEFRTDVDNTVVSTNMGGYEI